MPKAKTLTVEAVAGLGAERLAALLLEAAEHDLALPRSGAARGRPRLRTWGTVKVGWV